VGRDERSSLCTIRRECLAQSGEPFLYGESTMAGAMYAPAVTRFMTYDVKLEPWLGGINVCRRPQVAAHRGCSACGAPHDIPADI
jgi:hypothetical protein